IDAVGSPHPHVHSCFLGPSPPTSTETVHRTRELSDAGPGHRQSLMRDQRGHTKEKCQRYDDDYEPHLARPVAAELDLTESTRKAAERQAWTAPVGTGTSTHDSLCACRRW